MYSIYTINKISKSKVILGKFFLPIKEDLYNSYSLEEVEYKKREYIKSLCLNYKSVTELATKNQKLYGALKGRKMFVECYRHMIKNNSSRGECVMAQIISGIIPIENVKTNVYSVLSNKMELDVFCPIYNLAFEYDGCFWHRNNKKICGDLKKNEECAKKNITLIRIKEPLLGNQKIENCISSIKEQLIANIDIINRITHLNITSCQIYDINVDFDKVFKNIYDLSDITRAISCCQYLTDFAKEYPTYYAFVMRNKMRHLLSGLIRKKEHNSFYCYFSKDEFLEWARNTFTYYKEYTAHNASGIGLYRGWNKDVRAILPTNPPFNPKWNDYAYLNNLKLLEYIKKFNNYDEFIRYNDKKFYKFCHRRGLLHQIKEVLQH